MDPLSYGVEKNSQEGALLHLIGPDELPITEDGQPVTITLVGVDSAEYQEAMHANVSARRFKVRGGGVTLDSRAAERERIELLAACTKSWHGIDFRGVSPFPCTRENAMALYSEVRWIRDQVNEFIEDRSSFLGK